MRETINHPAHYQGCSSLTRDIAVGFANPDELDLEAIEVIERNLYGFHTGNALKYVWRAGLKGDAVEDLRKALWYLERYREFMGHSLTTHWGKVAGLIEIKIESLTL